MGRIEKPEVYVQIFDISDKDEREQYMAVLDYLVKKDIDTPIISKGNIRVIQFKGTLPPGFKDLELEQFSIGHIAPQVNIQDRYTYYSPS